MLVISQKYTDALDPGSIPPQFTFFSFSINILRDIFVWLGWARLCHTMQKIATKNEKNIFIKISIVATDWHR